MKQLTTYVLHGGATSKDHPSNQEFFKLFTSLVDKDEVNIIFCYWASDKSKWPKLIERDTAKIKGGTEKKVEFHVAEDPEDLFEALTVADVLYVAGGSNAEALESVYKDLSGIEDKLRGKVYIGSSMGAFMASENYVLSFDEQDSATVHSGLGLLPLQTLCHWDQEDKKELKMGRLREVSKQPVLTLNEAELVTLYQ